MRFPRPARARFTEEAADALGCAGTPRRRGFLPRPSAAPVTPVPIVSRLGKTCPLQKQRRAAADPDGKRQGAASRGRARPASYPGCTAGELLGKGFPRYRLWERGAATPHLAWGKFVFGLDPGMPADTAHRIPRPTSPGEAPRGSSSRIHFTDKETEAI